LVSYGPFEVAIVTNIRMRLKFEVARTPQVAVHQYILYSDLRPRSKSKP